MKPLIAPAPELFLPAEAELGDRRARVAIEAVQPQIDDGAFAIKRVVGDTVAVEADVFADGHDSVAAVLLYRHADEDQWNEAPMQSLVNDRWRGEFAVESIGTYLYTIAGWIDHFVTWKRDLRKRVAAGQNVEVDLLIGSQLVADAAEAAEGAEASRLEEFSAMLRRKQIDAPLKLAESEELSRLMFRWAPRKFATEFPRRLPVTVDRERAGFSAWYEMFPRSAGPEGRHGTLRDVEAKLPYVASMGFDVLYLPPIHPIGRAFRKGRNNSAAAGPEDAGSPWAIGAAEGGHKSIHPQLGTIEDFRQLVKSASRYGIELALDVAFQASPDHPYVRDHAEWFRKRPDGTIQYAENPPKKYQDIYPFDFEGDAWQELWEELRSVFEFWIDEGVRIFRVDNPHTKPFGFWQWVIGEIRRDWPETIFLSEAFTRPKVMYRLAKAGFTQSYTYFAWRDTKWELTEYFKHLYDTEVREYFRPNLWPNTPDILPESLQVGGRPAFMARLVLAATLAGNYGVYGPPYEHGWAAPHEPGSEEYLNSEKYEVHWHDLERGDSLSAFIARVNEIRRSTRAFVHGAPLEFVPVDNDAIICYRRTAADSGDAMISVVNLDPHHRQSGWVDLPAEWLELTGDRPFQMHDLLTDARFLWHGRRNFVELDPHSSPAHIFRLRRRTRSERDFEYFL